MFHKHQFAPHTHLHKTDKSDFAEEQDAMAKTVDAPNWGLPRPSDHASVIREWFNPAFASVSQSGEDPGFFDRLPFPPSTDNTTGTASIASSGMENLSLSYSGDTGPYGTDGVGNPVTSATPTGSNNLVGEGDASKRVVWSGGLPSDVSGEGEGDGAFEGEFMTHLLASRQSNFTSSSTDFPFTPPRGIFLQTEDSNQTPCQGGGNTSSNKNWKANNTTSVTNSANACAMFYNPAQAKDGNSPQGGVRHVDMQGEFDTRLRGVQSSGRRIVLPNDSLQHQKRLQVAGQSLQQNQLRSARNDSGVLEADENQGLSKKNCNAQMSSFYRSRGGVESMGSTFGLSHGVEQIHSFEGQPQHTSEDCRAFEHTQNFSQKRSDDLGRLRGNNLAENQENNNSNGVPNIIGVAVSPDDRQNEDTAIGNVKHLNPLTNNTAISMIQSQLERHDGNDTRRYLSDEFLHAAKGNLLNGVQCRNLLSSQLDAQAAALQRLDDVRVRENACMGLYERNASNAAGVSSVRPKSLSSVPLAPGGNTELESLSSEDVMLLDSLKFIVQRASSNSTTKSAPPVSHVLPHQSIVPRAAYNSSGGTTVPNAVSAHEYGESLGLTTPRQKYFSYSASCCAADKFSRGLSGPMASAEARMKTFVSSVGNAGRLANPVTEDCPITPMSRNAPMTLFTPRSGSAERNCPSARQITENAILSLMQHSESANQKNTPPNNDISLPQNQGGELPSDVNPETLSTLLNLAGFCRSDSTGRSLQQKSGSGFHEASHEVSPVFRGLPLGPFDNSGDNNVNTNGTRQPPQHLIPINVNSPLGADPGGSGPCVSPPALTTAAARNSYYRRSNNSNNVDAVENSEKDAMRIFADGSGEFGYYPFSSLEEAKDFVSPVSSNSGGLQNVGNKHPLPPPSMPSSLPLNTHLHSPLGDGNAYVDGTSGESCNSLTHTQVSPSMMAYYNSSSTTTDTSGHLLLSDLCTSTPHNNYGTPPGSDSNRLTSAEFRALLSAFPPTSNYQNSETSPMGISSRDASLLSLGMIPPSPNNPKPHQMGVHPMSGSNEVGYVASNGGGQSISPNSAMYPPPPTSKDFTSITDMYLYPRCGSNSLLQVSGSESRQASGIVSPNNASYGLQKQASASRKIYTDDRDRMVYVSWIPKKGRAYNAVDKRKMELDFKQKLRDMGLVGLTKVLLFPPKGVHCKLIFDRLVVSV